MRKSAPMIAPKIKTCVCPAKRGYEIMTVKQREMKIEALVNDLKAFGDDDLKRLLGFVERMKVGISKREAKKQVLND